MRLFDKKIRRWRIGFVSLCLCLYQTNLHMSRNTSTSNRTVLQSQASDRCRQNACFSGALRSRMGSTATRKSFLPVVASSALLQDQHPILPLPVAASLHILAVPRALWAAAQAPPSHAPHLSLSTFRKFVRCGWRWTSFLASHQRRDDSQLCQQH